MGNLTQKKMSPADVSHACNYLFEKYGDVQIVAEKFGISQRLVKKYVKFARLPLLLQENLSEIHVNPKIAIDAAVRAVDLLGYTRNGEISEEDVYELAKTIGKIEKN